MQEKSFLLEPNNFNKSNSLPGRIFAREDLLTSLSLVKQKGNAALKGRAANVIPRWEKKFLGIIGIAEIGELGVSIIENKETKDLQ